MGSQSLLESLESRVLLSAPHALPHAGSGLVNVGETVFFAGTTAKGGTELWETDGSARGTRQVKDIRPGSGSSVPERFTVLGNRLFFTATDDRGPGLWVTRGTARSTIKLASGACDNLTVVDGRLYFRDFRSKAGVLGLWTSDGTAAGTFIVRDHGFPSPLVGGEKTLYGVAGSIGPEPDFGADVGIYRVPAKKPVRQLARYTLDHATTWLAMVQGDAVLYQPEGGKLWSADANGTRPIGPGTIDNANGQAVKLGDKTYYVAAGASGRELWRTDGTVRGTVKVGDLITPELTIDGNTVRADHPTLYAADRWILASYYFRSGSSDRIDVWKIDPANAAMTRLQTFTPSQQTAAVGLYTTTPVQGGIAFNVFNDGSSTYFSDGTPGGTRLLVNNANMVGAVDTGRAFFFTSRSSSQSWADGELWMWNYAAGKSPRRV